MKIAPFLLDHWLKQKATADPPIEYDLGSSYGPPWTLRELIDLGGEGEHERLLDTPLLYTNPEGTPALREALAEMAGVPMDAIQVVTGAAEALLLLFYSAAEPGANVVLSSPGFPTNTALAESLGIEIRPYHLRVENQFRIDVDEIRGLLDDNTKFVLVNTPHNPTGAILTDDELDRLHDLCADRGIQLIVDEVYHPIYHGAATRSASRLPHATVISDFSKALCLSGLRAGWMIEHDAHRREEYLNARSYFTVSNTSLGERLATLAIERREAIYDRARTVAAGNLALLDGLMAAHADLLDWIRPRGGMTAFPWLRSGVNAREFCQRLMRRGVMIAPGDCFEMPAHFRLGFAASGAGFAAAIERVDDFLRAERQMAQGAAS